MRYFSFSPHHFDWNVNCSSETEYLYVRVRLIYQSLTKITSSGNHFLENCFSLWLNIDRPFKLPYPFNSFYLFFIECCSTLLCNENADYAPKLLSMILFLYAIVFENVSYAKWINENCWFEFQVFKYLYCV